jgi:hypothetical protein
MRADTQSVTVPVDPGHIFAFLAEPANLPRWAVGFAQDVRRDGEDWIVTTGQGEVPVRIVADAASGVIDFHLTPMPDVEVVAYSRVVANGDGAEYVFTQVQAPGMPDGVFEDQIAALRHELELLTVLFQARAACPTAR